MAPKAVNPLAGGSGARLPRPAKAKALENAIWKAQATSGRKRHGSPTQQADVPAHKERHTHPRQANVTKHSHHNSGPVANPATVPPISSQKKRKIVVESDEDDGKSEHETDHDDPDENIIDDLKALESSRLRDTLSSESVQWSHKPQRKKSVSSHDVQSLPSADEDSADLPELEHPSAITTASEIDQFQGEDEELEDYNETSGDETSFVRPVRKLKSNQMKRVKARQAEIPKWGRTIGDTRYREQTQKAAVAMGFLDDSEGLQDFKDDPWPDAPWCPPGSGQRIMSIFAQPPNFRVILQHAIRQLTGDAMTRTAYISVEETPIHIVKTIKQSARKFNSEEYRMRLEKDVMLKVEVVRLMNNRLSIYRAKTKKIAHDLIEVKYLLNDDSDRKVQVDKLIKNTVYIYPEKPDGSGIINTKPFHHPAIIRIISDMYFTVRRGQSLADKHAARFTSSITEGPRAHELEVPAAMVAMVATAIHASFDDFASKRDFSADVYEDVYRKHINFLDDLRNMGIGKYHKIMASLYTIVSSNSTQVVKASNDAMHLLNFADMSE
ncbi:hypothetical protein M378DRAFT_14732 [Amanita muscaria Koide BX008]|uniref:DUF6532 domain-containing protein n=1 Tax=Amanita muscaria (strain Koide BX008) TaxID=946122 RepID=A0A0C2WS95_AMAMK|nr:hypothetical protein M378DRAFT_14732 [Amanita muscaria Koide BX008]